MDLCLTSGRRRFESYNSTARRVSPKALEQVLTKKNQIVDCPDAEALAAFKHSVRDEWLARHLGQEKPRTMAALTSLMTRFCAGEDSWLARSSTSDPSTSEVRDGNGKP